MRPKRYLFLCTTAVVLSGCGDRSDVESDDPSESAGEGHATTGPVDPGFGETGDPGGTEESGETTAPGGSFIPGDDIPDDFGPQCDVWAQDCSAGEKCMPWDAQGGGSWSSTRCTPLAPSPAQPGDECTVEQSGVSGIDDCELGSMCWDVDPETQVGTCVAFCQGSLSSHTCDDPGTVCSIFNEGVLILCLPQCDPLVQDCGDSQGCYGGENGFVCIPDASGPDSGSYGDPCGFVNVCDPGLFCAGASAVPDCQGAQGCCSEFCDANAPDGASACSGAAGGQACVPWYEEGQAPPGYEDVGACVIPD